MAYKDHILEKKVLSGHCQIGGLTLKISVNCHSLTDSEKKSEDVENMVPSNNEDRLYQIDANEPDLDTFEVLPATPERNMNESNILDNDTVSNITGSSTSSSVLTLSAMSNYANLNGLNYSEKEIEDNSSPYLHGRLHQIDKHNGTVSGFGADYMLPTVPIYIDEQCQALARSPPIRRVMIESIRPFKSHRLIRCYDTLRSTLASMEAVVADVQVRNVSWREEESQAFDFNDPPILVLKADSTPSNGKRRSPATRNKGACWSYLYLGSISLKGR